jgi:hypothetical protein
MMKWLKILLTGIVVSLFYFPVTFTFFPVSNTKNLLGALGLVCMVVVLIKKEEFSLPRELLIFLLLSSFVSIASLLAININQTPDTTYVPYIRSAIIWLSSAFATCCIIYLTHKRIDVPLVVNYLAWVSVFQCAMALLIEFIPAVRMFVDANVQQGQALLQDMGRLYGIGASLDVAGSHFAAVLVALGFLMVQGKKERGNTPQLLLIIPFIIITIIGNMIARTTLVGVLVALAYVVLMELRNFGWQRYDKDYRSSLGSWIVALAILVPISVLFYNISPEFNKLMRFGFEGFFSYFEKGEWTTDSTAKLETMYVWPDNLKTWIVGDGYFANQRNDPNYIGTATVRGYYMGTDVGYCRFIFYFGIIGLITISAVMIYAGLIAIKAFPKSSHLFMMGVACNFIIWLKVSTDLLPFLALFATLAFLTSDVDFIRSKQGLDNPDKEEEPVPVP